MPKRVLVGTLTLLLMLGMLTAGVLVERFLVPPTSQQEKRIAHFEKDHAGFIRQIQASAGTYVENAGVPVFDNHIVQAPPPRVEPETVSRVLGIDTVQNKAEKWIDIDLSDQQLTTWEGARKLKDYPVSTGLARSPTVKGEFRVWRKVLSQGYRGGSKAQGNYYYLPNVPYSLFFHNGYAIHAAYWHNDFGIRPRSHGCVNMRTADAKEVYEWADPVMPVGLRTLNTDDTNPGTRVVVHE